MGTKTIRLTIPTPCQQRWQDMTTDDTGRFCASCQKTVVDFSHLTDQQLIVLLAQHNGSGCGRFRADQLNRAVSVAAPVSHSPVRLLSWLLAGMIGYQTVNANPLSGETKATSTHPSDTTLVPSMLPAIDTAPPTDSVRVVTGRVIEQTTSSPVPGVGILIKGTTEGTNTDAEGYFQVRIPAELTSDQLTLKIAGIGYLTQELQLKSGQLNAPLISLQEDSAALAEVIMVGGYKRASFFQRLWHRLRGNH